MTRGVIRHLHPLDLTDDTHLELECKGLCRYEYSKVGATFLKEVHTKKLYFLLSRASP